MHLEGSLRPDALSAEGTVSSCWASHRHSPELGLLPGLGSAEENGPPRLHVPFLGQPASAAGSCFA